MSSKSKKSNVQKKHLRTKRAWIVDIPTSVCVFFIVVGIIMGNVFVIVPWSQGKLIDKDEAISVAATFDSYTIHTSPKGALDEVEICFSDHEKLYIDGAYFDIYIESSLDNLQEGDKLYLLLHPVSNYVWDMRSDETQIISFEDARSGILLENILFSVVLGSFMYFGAIIGAISLFLQWKEKRKTLKHRH